MFVTFNIRLHRPRTNSFLTIFLQAEYAHAAMKKAEKQLPGWVVIEWGVTK